MCRPSTIYFPSIMVVIPSYYTVIKSVSVSIMVLFSSLDVKLEMFSQPSLKQPLAAGGP